MEISSSRKTDLIPPSEIKSMLQVMTSKAWERMESFLACVGWRKRAGATTGLLFDELWYKTILTAVSQPHGLKAQLGNECQSVPCCISYCLTWHPLLLIYSVDLNHLADVQSNVTDRAKAEISHHRL